MHAIQRVTDMGTYKRLLVGGATDGQDLERIATAPHGGFVKVNTPESVKEVELGGASDSQAQAEQYTQDMADRASGINDNLRGNLQKGVTASASDIAQQGTEARTAWITQRFTAGVRSVFRAAGWYQYYGEDVIYKGLGVEAAEEGIMEWRGGLMPGQEEMDYSLLQVKILPQSLEYVGDTIVQKRMLEAFGLLTQTAPMMVQMPHVDWRKALNRVFESMNLGSADQLFDEDALNQMYGMAQQQAQLPVGQSESVQPASTQAAQERGAEMGSVVAVG